MKIIKTNPSEAEYALFEALPGQLYPADSIRHRQSDGVATEYLQGCYVGLSETGVPQVRASLFFNPHLHHQQRPAACMGHYECVPEAHLARQFIQHLAHEARQLGAGLLIGPMDGSTWDNYRFSVHHHHPPFLLEPYHHVYYNDHFLEAGFQLLAAYSSSLDTEVHCDQPEVLALEAQFESAGVHVRSINLAEYEAELARLYPFVSLAFSTNFLYTPISWERFRAKYLQAVRIMDPHYVLLAESPDGDLIGFIFCYPDLYNQHEKSLVVKTIARHPDRRWSGLGHVLANQAMRLARQQGYESVVHAFMIESGTSTPISRNFLGTQYKKYALYQLEL